MGTGGWSLQVGQDAALVPEQAAVAQLDGGDEVGPAAHLGLIPGTQRHTVRTCRAHQVALSQGGVESGVGKLTRQPGSVRTETPSPAGPAATHPPAATTATQPAHFLLHNPERVGFPGGRLSL